MAVILLVIFILFLRKRFDFNECALMQLNLIDNFMFYSISGVSEQPKHNPVLITMVIMLRSNKDNRNNFYCFRPHNHHSD